MTRARVSIADLEFAATWMEAYEGQDDDDNNLAAARVAAWLRAEVAHRVEEIDVRAVVARTGVSPARARVTLRRLATKARANP